MNTLQSLYQTSLALLTDVYQLTMAYGYWKNDMAEREAVFHLYFRKSPFEGGFAICGGLGTAIEYLNGLSFSEDDLVYLASLSSDNQQPLFEPAFLEYLKNLRLTVDIDAIPEGTTVFPHEPLLRVKGPLLQCQLLETALLTIINFQTLIATKAARVCHAAQGEPVLEFGLRRAQGFDGGIAASRAAYLGGCAATSTLIAGKLYGIPVKGTHAHSWILAFDDEVTAFRAYAKSLPNHCVFLVDTYNTLGGIKNAIKVGLELRQQGQKLAGVRLDSGDLAYLSIKARQLLDAAGFQDTQIIASNNLDEHIIDSLKAQGAKITVWGVGTKLSTAYDQPALNGIYKLAALKDAQGVWQYKLKLSEQVVKINTPGILSVRRFFEQGRPIADVIYDEQLGMPETCVIVDPVDATRRRRIKANTESQELLVPIYRHGQLVYQQPSLKESRQHTLNNLGQFHQTIQRFLNPHIYPVGLEKQLHDLKTQLILKARGL